MDTETRLRIEEIWSRLRHEETARSLIAWSYQITPPFPSEWPLHAQSRLVYYVYATGHDISGRLADGVYIAAPWAQVEKPLNGEQAVEIRTLRTALRTVGIQGIHPLSPDEVLFGQGEPIEHWFVILLRSMPNPDSEALRALKRFYQSWRSQNGAILETFSAEYRAFLQWVNE
jgi:hypothetical protein